jgi:hypothetical protein
VRTGECPNCLAIDTGRSPAFDEADDDPRKGEELEEVFGSGDEGDGDAGASGGGAGGGGGAGDGPDTTSSGGGLDLLTNEQAAARGNPEAWRRKFAEGNIDRWGTPDRNVATKPGGKVKSWRKHSWQSVNGGGDPSLRALLNGFFTKKIKAAKTEEEAQSWANGQARVNLVPTSPEEIMLDVVGLLSFVDEVAEAARLAKTFEAPAEVVRAPPAAAVGRASPAVEVASEGAARTWRLGAGKSAAKWEGQMAERGWTPELIDEAVAGGEQIRAVNKATGNAATRYVHPTTGQSVVIDDVTGEVLQVGGPGFRFGPESGDLP